MTVKYYAIIRGMKKFLAVLFLPVLAGCFSVKPPPTVNWLIEPSLKLPPLCESPRLGESRLAIVVVQSPYDSRNFVVRRKDGSTAFDPCNVFAASPAALLKGTALDVIRAAGVFKGVQPSVTTADIRDMLELAVEDLSLDCREEGMRKATVRVKLAHLYDRRVVACGSGFAQVDVTSGNYAKAFGSAFEKAVCEALKSVER